jgi:phenylalanine-4-hydroxylase
VKSHKTNRTPENEALNGLYAEVRSFRERLGRNPRSLDPVHSALGELAPDDWLLRLELLELYSALEPEGVTIARLRNELSGIRNRKPEFGEMIERGIECL